MFTLRLTLFSSLLAGLAGHNIKRVSRAIESREKKVLAGRRCRRARLRAQSTDVAQPQPEPPPAPSQPEAAGASYHVRERTTVLGGSFEFGVRTFPPPARFGGCDVVMTPVCVCVSRDSRVSSHVCRLVQLSCVTNCVKKIHLTHFILTSSKGSALPLRHPDRDSESVRCDVSVGGHKIWSPARGSSPSLHGALGAAHAGGGAADLSSAGCRGVGLLR